MPEVPFTGMPKDFPGPGKTVPAKIERDAVAVPPGLKVTVVGLIDQPLQPGWEHSGGEGTNRFTAPLSPFTLVTVIVDDAELPSTMDRLAGFAEIAKSGTVLLEKIAV